MAVLVFILFYPTIEYPNAVKPKKPESEPTDLDATILPELEGDVSSLRLIDLDKEGLSEYRNYLIKLGVINREDQDANKLRHEPRERSKSLSGTNPDNNFRCELHKKSNPVTVDTLVEDIFSSFDPYKRGTISVNDVSRLLLRLNSRFKRHYGINIEP